MNDTAIRWTEVTWNPMSGCQKVSPGCKHCYAETLAERYRGTTGFPNGFDLTIRPHKLREPIGLKQPSLIFVNSMSDLFWDKVPMEYRDKIVDVIEGTPQHQYQVLTKRADALLAYSKRRKLPPNFWAGVSVETQEYAKKRIPLLVQVQAEVRFLSMEPLLGPVDIRPWVKQLQWVITGGESGNHLQDEQTRAARGLVQLSKVGGRSRWSLRDDRAPWIRDIRDACREAKVPFFHKQNGGAKPESGGYMLDGESFSEFPRYPEKGGWR